MSFTYLFVHLFIYTFDYLHKNIILIFLTISKGFKTHTHMRTHYPTVGYPRNDEYGILSSNLILLHILSTVLFSEKNSERQVGKSQLEIPVRNWKSHFCEICKSLRFTYLTELLKLL